MGGKSREIGEPGQKDLFFCPKAFKGDAFDADPSPMTMHVNPSLGRLTGPVEDRKSVPDEAFDIGERQRQHHGLRNDSVRWMAGSKFKRQFLVSAREFAKMQKTQIVHGANS